MAVPQQMQMGGGNGFPALAGPNLFVKQTKRGCLQELMGCDAKTEFKIATMENQQGDFLYALEDTSCMNRFICGGNRPWEINVTQGAEAGGPLVAKYERPFRLAASSCKCCCYQEVLSTLPSGQANGSVVETFWMFVPMFNVVGPGGDVEYKLSMPTCMGGMCVNIFAEGLCNCRVPFYIFKPDSGTTAEEKVGNITKIWAGLGAELFTDADKFEVNFPADASQESKARLLGATFLINQIFFESRNGLAD